MLKAAIVYLPGSGGTFLYRTLTLSERTGHGDTTSELHYNQTIDAKTRLNNYTAWTGDNWKQGEIKWATGYKSGLARFVDYEVTPISIIDHWHPSEFLHHDQHSIAWETGVWPNIIFIDSANYQEFLLKNQWAKQYHLNWDKEMIAFNELKTQYADRAITIDFDCFFDEDRYVTGIHAIDQQLNLDLNYDYVRELWRVWYAESQKAWA